MLGSSAVFSAEMPWLNASQRNPCRPELCEIRHKPSLGHLSNALERRNLDPPCCPSTLTMVGPFGPLHRHRVGGHSVLGGGQHGAGERSRPSHPRPARG